MHRAAALFFLSVLWTSVSTGAEKPVNDDLYRKGVVAAISGMIRERETASGTLLRNQFARSGGSLTLPEPLTARLSPSEVYTLRRSSVVVVTAVCRGAKGRYQQHGYASGWAIAAGGYVATNYHAVKDDHIVAFGVTTLDGKTHPVHEVVAANKDADLAILRTGATDLVPIPLAVGVLPGAPVTCLGHPQGQFYSLTTGVLSRRGLYGGQTYLAITGEFASGSSGSPVMDECGNAVGMAMGMKYLYHDEREGKPADVEMTIRLAVPAEDIVAAARRGARTRIWSPGLAEETLGPTNR